jgi:hypothetical protein
MNSSALTAYAAPSSEGYIIACCLISMVVAAVTLVQCIGMGPGLLIRVVMTSSSCDAAVTAGLSGPEGRQARAVSKW